MSQSELLEIRASAKAAITSGRRTSISGGAKSGSKEYPGDPYRDLMEVNYALARLGVVSARVTKTYNDFANIPCPATVPNEQV